MKRMLDAFRHRSGDTSFTIAHTGPEVSSQKLKDKHGVGGQACDDDRVLKVLYARTDMISQSSIRNVRA